MWLRNDSPRRRVTLVSVMLKEFLPFLCLFGFTACQHNGYRVQDGKVILYHGLSDKTPVPGADPKTFKGINEHYGKDKSHVFIRYQILENADPATFEILSSSYTRDA